MIKKNNDLIKTLQDIQIPVNFYNINTIVDFTAGFPTQSIATLNGFIFLYAEKAQNQ